MTDNNAPISNETTVAENANVENVTEVSTTEVVVEGVQSKKSILDLVTREELKNIDSIKEIETIDDLVDKFSKMEKSHQHAQSLVGKRINQLTGDDLKHINLLKGVPESADKYIVPEEMGEQYTSEYKDLAFKAGLTQEQAKNLMDNIILKQREVNEASKETVKQLEESHKAELEQIFGKAVDKRIEISHKYLDELDNTEIKGIKELLVSNGLDKNPKIVKLLSDVYINFYEKDKVVASDVISKHGYTPQEARSMIDRMSKANIKAIADVRHPDHNRVSQELSELYKYL